MSNMDLQFWAIWADRAIMWKIYSTSLKSPSLRVVFFTIFMGKTNKKNTFVCHDT